MRFGGPVWPETPAPEAWIAALRAKKYRAAFCPVEAGAADSEIEAYAAAAREANIVIAEVGAWSNPLSPDAAQAEAAIAHCQRQLALAERIGARCCVNIAGSCGARWDGPHPENLSEETFDRIVGTVRRIIDAVRPTRTFYTLETMPWVYPDSAENYLELVRAIDRPRFAVHLDPVNMVSSPRRYYDTASLLRSCFEQLGPFIKSCHAKDIRLRDDLTVHLEEVRPGLGVLDYPVYLGMLSRLDADTPLMLEHLPSEEEYDRAAAFIRGVDFKR